MDLVAANCVERHDVGKIGVDVCYRALTSAHFLGRGSCICGSGSCSRIFSNASAGVFLSPSVRDTASGTEEEGWPTVGELGDLFPGLLSAIAGSGVVA